MCMGKSPAPPPAPPPPPASEPLKPAIGDDAKKSTDEQAIKTSGKQRLRIDLGVGGNPDANQASGLVI